jgi:chromosome segregation ATPase
VHTARRAVLFAAAAGTFWIAAAWAQVERSGGGANAVLVQQYQQAVAERAQLQTDNAKLKKDTEELKKQLGTLQQQAAASKLGAERSQASVAASRVALEDNQKNLEDLKGKMQELVSRFRETIAALHDVESERTQLQQQLSQNRRAFDQCAERNYALYQVNNEVLHRYEHQNALSYLARAEPFTRLKRTQIENLVDEYRQRAEELRVKKAGASPTSDAGAVPPRNN